MEALKAIYEDDFRVVNEREKSLRTTIRSDDGSLSLDLLVRLRERERERERINDNSYYDSWYNA